MFAITIILLTVSTSFAAPFAYITNQGSHDVSVIDTAIDKVIATVPVGKSPAGVVAVSAVGKVFVTNPEGRNISVIDMRTQRVIDTLAAGEAPLGLDASRDGRTVYVADWQSHQLLAFDTRTHALAWHVNTGKVPSGVAAHPDNTRVFITERDDDQVAVINTLTHDITQRIPTQSHPFSLVLDRKGEKLYALNVLSDSVSVISAAPGDTGRMLATITVGKAPYGCAESSDGRFMYVSNQHGETVSVIDTQRLKVSETLKGFEYPEGIMTLADKLYVVNWMSDSVSVLKAETGKLLTEIAVGKNPRGYGAFIGAYIGAAQ